MTTNAADPRFNVITSTMQSCTLKTIPWRLHKGSLVTLRYDATVRDALTTLTANNILSAPVFDAAGTFQGFCDMEQLTRFIVRLADGEIPTSQWWTKHDRIRTTTIRDLVRGVGTGGRQIHGEYRTPISENVSIYHAVERMVREGQHRLAVQDYTGRVVSIVTQSAIISYLNDNMALLGEGRFVPINKIRPYLFVSTVSENALALRGFEHMDRRNTSLNGIGVVNTEGRLVNVLSTHDLRGLTPGSSGFNKLYLTVKEFKTNVDSRFPGRHGRCVQSVVTTATLEDVIRMMATMNVHRVFIVNNLNDKVPIDIVSQTDVLRYLLSAIKSWW